MWHTFGLMAIPTQLSEEPFFLSSYGPMIAAWSSAWVTHPLCFLPPVVGLPRNDIPAFCFHALVVNNSLWHRHYYAWHASQRRSLWQCSLPLGWLCHRIAAMGTAMNLQQPNPAVKRDWPKCFIFTASSDFTSSGSGQYVGRPAPYFRRWSS